MRLILTAGQIADIDCAEELVEGLRCSALIADKGYDSNALVTAVERTGAQAVIPPRSNRLVQRHYDRHLYRTRNLIERFFNRLKHFRRVATRYDHSLRQALSQLSGLCSTRLRIGVSLQLLNANRA